jgi:hypothetical protein
LEKSIHIEWTLPRLDNRNGVVSLREIKLDEDMISSLELCPLEWKLTLNGQDPAVNSNVMLGQECILEMCVINHFEFDVDGHFNVEVQMEEQQHQQQQQEHQKLIIQSQPQSRIFRCCSQASMSHTSSLLPLVSGTYDVVCSCSIVQVMQTKDDGETTASLEQCYKSIQHHRSQIPEEVENSYGSLKLESSIEKFWIEVGFV